MGQENEGTFLVLVVRYSHCWLCASGWVRFLAYLEALYDRLLF